MAMEYESNSINEEESPKGEKNVSILTEVAYYTIAGFFFILPFFFLPFLSFSLGLTKTVLIIVGVLLALMLFVVGRLKDGFLSIPLSLPLAGAWLLPIAYIISTLFSSGNASISFIGQRLGTDTVFFITVGVLLLTLIPLVVRTKQRILSIYAGLLLGFFVVAVFQGIRMLFGVDVLSFGVFTSSISNLIGKWNDLSIFFGLVAVLSLITLEGLSLHVLSKTILYTSLVIALFFLSVINFALVWYVLGFFSLGFFIYSLLKRKFSFSGFYPPDGSAESAPKMRGAGLSIASLLILIISVVFIVGGQSLSNYLGSSFGISQIEARPSFKSTIAVARDTYNAEGSILGSGPNTFRTQWDRYKPRAINETVFWNSDFNSGVGFVPTSFITTGILGGISWIIFLGLFLYSGVRSLLVYPVEDRFAYYLSLSSFISALYLWVLTVLYVPNSVMLAFAFLFTGLYLASLRHRERGYSEKTIVFSANPRLGFVFVLTLTVVLAISSWGAYALAKRYISTVYFQKAVITLNQDGDEVGARRLVNKSRNLASNDEVSRLSADLEVRALNRTLSDTSTPIDERRSQFRDTLAVAIEDAMHARDIDPLNYRNWFLLGRVYQSVVPLGIGEAYGNAKAAYEQALTLSPRSPVLYLALAELEVLNGDTKAARGHIREALEEKNNYTGAVFLLAQIQVNDGEVSEAIRSVEAATLLEPNNPVVFFQLGLLKYNQEDYAGSSDAFKSAIALNDVYANARYFLGLSYYRINRVNDAIKQFKRVLETNPDNEEVKLILTNLQAGNEPLLGIPNKNKPQNREGPPFGNE